jgi:general secretion pathway protein L
MIGAFFSWWLGQLADLLPPWLRRPAFARVDALVIAPIEPLDSLGAVAVTVRRNGKETPVGEFPLRQEALESVPAPRGRPAVLRIARDDLLEKTLTLPIAARDDLAQVLAFEMDRETPFSADELYWNYCAETVDQRQGRISVHLILIPKARLAPLLAVLGQCGLAPKWVEIADGRADCSYLPIDHQRARPQHQSRWLLAGAAACCAVLAAGAAVVPFALQAAELAALDREIRAGQTTATEADALRREIDRLSRSAEVVRKARENAARPIEVLASVTRLLPDDTYLTDIDLRQRKLTLSGRSAAAARLIGALAADRSFRNPSFAAPVTHIESLRVDVFTIVAEMGAPS